METINKTEALNRLTSLENEAKKLREIIDAPVNIIERAKSFEAACRESKRSRLEITVIDLIPDKVRKAQERIELFAEVLREGKDPSECFYYPYFKRSSGGGFSSGDCDCGVAAIRLSGRASAWIPQKKRSISARSCWKIIAFYLTANNFLSLLKTKQC